VKSASKTTAAKKTTAKTTAKPAAKTAATPAKTAAKSMAKSTVKKPAAAAKKTARKAKPVTIDTICGLIEKKIVKSKIASVKSDVAVDIEVWGFEDGSNQKMYIEIKDGKASVMPHSYDAKDFRVSLSFANAMDFANGKLTLVKLLESKDFYAEGNIVAAIILASIF
ncbi:MAG: SCP2 sterol-binding domain-containing protein, partial [Oscillospiraceae bacterium]|nr:SCP2 sterol-binding domain-containing protein [Oscillospiraceae bacterium]